GITTSLVSGSRSCSPPPNATDARVTHATRTRTGGPATARTSVQHFSRAYAELPTARLTSRGPDGYLRRNVIARSSAHVESSRDNSHRPSIVSPSALSFPLNFCEKPGEGRHILQTPSHKLTCYMRSTPPD